MAWFLFYFCSKCKLSNFLKFLSVGHFKPKFKPYFKPKLKTIFSVEFGRRASASTYLAPRGRPRRRSRPPPRPPTSRACWPRSARSSRRTSRTGGATTPSSRHSYAPDSSELSAVFRIWIRVLKQIVQWKSDIVTLLGMGKMLYYPIVLLTDDFQYKKVLLGPKNCDVKRLAYYPIFTVIQKVRSNKSVS